MSAEATPSPVDQAPESKTVITPIPLGLAQTPASQEQLEALRERFQNELDALNQQIYLIQAKATALEAQLNSIEPKIEARASRTEKLVAELQIDIQKMTKAFNAQGRLESATLDGVNDIKKMIATLLPQK